jgi:hypothetical protein
VDHVVVLIGGTLIVLEFKDHRVGSKDVGSRGRRQAVWTTGYEMVARE